jgi:hypothetical protein
MVSTLKIDEEVVIALLRSVKNEVWFSNGEFKGPELYLKCREKGLIQIDAVGYIEALKETVSASSSRRDTRAIRLWGRKKPAPTISRQ